MDLNNIKRNQLDYILKDIYLAKYDAIFFSTYIWNIYDIVKLCENIKKVNPNVIIGLGGPEVSYEQFFDFSQE